MKREFASEPQSVTAPSVRGSQSLPLAASFFTYFERVRDPRPAKAVTLAELMTDIISGRWAEPVHRIRACSDKAEADLLKVGTLPAIKVSGMFRGRTADSLVAHSGLLCLDFDHLDKQLGSFRARIVEDPHVCAVFISPRGRGLKAIVAVDATCAETHRRCFNAARHYFIPWLPPGAELDCAPSNVASNCFVSHDPSARWVPGVRSRFAAASLEAGCRIDIAHDVKTLDHDVEFPEKEPSSSTSSSGVGEEKREPDTPGNQKAVSTPSTPLRPSSIELPGVVRSRVWRDWLEPQRHQPQRRNAVIVGRVPILLNLVGPEVVALLLLQWYRVAPSGMFKDDELTHWRETWAQIRSCLASWPDHRGRFALSGVERAKYSALATDRQRDAFRICRSLSLAKANIATRTFFLSGSGCAERLMIPTKAGERQLEYLVKAGAIEVVHTGSTWSKGRAPSASRYRWCL